MNGTEVLLTVGFLGYLLGLLTCLVSRWLWNRPLFDPSEAARVARQSEIARIKAEVRELQLKVVDQEWHEQDKTNSRIKVLQQHVKELSSEDSR